jgi:hypothetical protein
MKKEKIKELAKDNRFISGIYNYCDRWCERCPQTSRCLNYAMAEEEFNDPQTRDIHNEAFWEKLTETFQETLALLKEMADQEGIDLNAIDTDEFEAHNRLIEESAENHVICRSARAYIDMVEDWFNDATALFGEENETGLDHRSAICDDEEPEGSSLEEAMEVVRWYQHQIYVKLMRAMRGLQEEESEFSDETNQYVKDSDGTAKVALIGIDRSVAAWGTIRNQFPYHNSHVLKLLVHLDQLKRAVEEAFPNARGFLRPGFDRIDLNG